MLKPSFPIVTDRLVLRPFRPDDLQVVHAWERLPEVARFLYWEPRDLEASREVLGQRVTRVALLEEGDVLDLAVTLRETGQVIGQVLLIWTSRQHQQGEIGYVLHPDFHGKGYAPEASRQMLRLGFEELGLHRIVGRLDGRNTASARVLEKLGMRREAHLVENELVKGEWSDEVVYAMLGSEWAGLSRER
ncbi:GNAT family N-acetyltransferase [Nonomuraea sp. NPDC059194]|uniref:GNAT family N-acetyltransferase n=1 Tax=Nonomuraea sp. NPDC059194 TaxID=3346764 RepID=UPI003690BC7E